MPIEKRWVVKPQGDSEAVAKLAAVLRISPVLANLLVQRGIDTVEKADKFFKPSLADLHDPFLMKDMDKAVERVEQAVRNNEKIMVYGDYDVDGCTAVALVYKFLRQIGHKNLMFYIPDRYTEGYGISVKGIDLAARKGVGLIIALDCGIKATEKVVYAKTKGVDFIICDHHLPAEEIPRAVAVLDPKRVDCSYPFDELSGCGVGFKLVQAYAQKNRIPFEQISPLLDLLVVSIASDIVPLVGENRILAHFGLKNLNREPSKGLLSIIKICGLDKHNITIDDIVFKIGPRINAAGRMRMDENDENASPSGGHAAVELLIEGNESIAAEFGNVIDAYNQDRKSIDRSVTQEAHDFIERNPAMKELKSTVIYNPKWMKGIVGIVASRLIETYYRPTVVLTMSNGFVTGSARSVPGFDLYQAVESCSDLLENFGGHMYAAGLTMRPENVEEFTRRFNAYVEENIDPQMLMPQVDIDSELLFSDITPAFRKDLNRFQPFGPGNTAPVFATYGVSNHGDAKLVGMECEHLRMDLIQRQKPNTKIQSIAFQQPTHYEWVRSGRPIDVCYQIVMHYSLASLFPMNIPTTRLGLRPRPFIWVLLLGCILAYPLAPAVSSPSGDKRDYILVINTYAESTPWSRGIITDITARVEQIENLELYTEHINLLLVDSPREIETFETNLLREYGKKPPRALVLIGTPTALLRNFINSIWKGIPTIVCAEQDFVGPDKYYQKRLPIPASEQVPLRTLADRDNLTLLYSPAYLDQSIDLMKRILPGMDRLIFIDDARYVNRQTEHDLAELLDSKYGGIKYTVYSADEIGIDQLLDSLSTVDVKRTGVLFSSWHYLKNMSGRNEIMTNPFKIIASSSVPLFSLRPTGLKSSGMIGGYVYDENEYSDRLIATVNAVLEGKQPRDIPFYTPVRVQPVFNYPVLLRHNISPNTCPTNTLFFDVHGAV